MAIKIGKYLDYVIDDISWASTWIFDGWQRGTHRYRRNIKAIRSSDPIVPTVSVSRATKMVGRRSMTKMVLKRSTYFHERSYESTNILRSNFASMSRRWLKTSLIFSQYRFLFVRGSMNEEKKTSFYFHKILKLILNIFLTLR